MNCPACGHALTSTRAGAVTVDVCTGGCAGLWFDQFEIRKFDEPHEGEGESLLDVPRDDALVIDHARRLRCPKCSDSVMMRHCWSAKQSVEVDECGVCGGYWLDHGELKRIRSLFKTEDERREAARRYFRDVLGEDIARMKTQGEKGLRVARRIGHLLRFLRPSYYIEG